MNKLWSRQRELYNRAFGKFVSVHIFTVEDWLSPDDLIEYTKLKKED